MLHTRVSEELSDDIRRLARDLRVPASNLVRNVLEEVFSVVETVSDDVGDLLEDVIDEAEAARDRIRWRSQQRRQRVKRRKRAASEEDVEDELRRDEKQEAAPSAPPEFDDVLGWQPLVLNQERACARCARPLRRGEQGSVGLTEKGLSGPTLCSSCTEAA